MKVSLDSPVSFKVQNNKLAIDIHMIKQIEKGVENRNIESAFLIENDATPKNKSRCVAHKELYTHVINE